MKLVVLTHQKQIDESRRKWDALAVSHPFCNWNWMSSWYEVFGDSDINRVVAIEEAGTWHGLLPLILRTTAQGRSLAFASSGRACADYVSPLVHPGSEDIVIPTFCHWIQEQLNDPQQKIDFLEFEGVAADCPIFQALIAELENQGYKATRQPIEGCWVTKIDKPWNVFESEIKKSFRRKVRKAGKNEQLPEVSVVKCDSEQSLPGVWGEFVRLHQLRRQVLGQPGCFADAQFETFLRKAIGKMIADRQAHLIGAKYHNEMFASVLLLTGGNRTYMYQTGHDPKRKELEPGHLLGRLAIQHAMKLGHESFDFLRGDEPYKANWNTERIALEKVNIISKRLQSRIRHSLWETGRAIKNWLPASLISPSQV